MVVSPILSQESIHNLLCSGVVDMLPNPVFVKDEQLRYVLVNKAFEELFGVEREDVISQRDADVLNTRQISQCNGGDLRVLNSGEIDEAYETVFRANGEVRETMTRKNRIQLQSGEVFLVGIIHDLTDITLKNRELERSKKQLQYKTAELNNMAFTDGLTGCKNHRWLMTYGEKLLQNNEQANALLILDLDKFKAINDTYGHMVGDQALVHISKLVRRLLPQSAQLVRLGGDEFVVLLPDVEPIMAEQLAERIVETIESKPLQHKFQNISITTSVGLLIDASKRDHSIDVMMKSADKHLYRAKKAGRNKVERGLFTETD